MTYTTISSKGQITLPTRALKKLGLKPSDRLEIQETGGELHLRKAPDFMALKGSVKAKRQTDEKKAMLRGVSRHVQGRRA